MGDVAEVVEVVVAVELAVVEMVVVAVEVVVVEMVVAVAAASAPNERPFHANLLSILLQESARPRPLL